MPLVRFLVVGLAKLLSKVFGLATMTFFGRMPSRDADKMTLVALLSLMWLLAVAAIVYPDLAAMLPAVPDGDTVRRLIAVAATVAIPVINGAIISRVHNRDGGMRDAMVQLAAGFPYTAIIGAVVVGVVVTVPLVKANYLVRWFETKHLMVMIPEGSYEQAYEHIFDLLASHDASPRRARANPVVRGMFHGLTTWDDDSQAVEDRRRDCRDRLERVGGLGLDKEEWDALRRNLYRLERDIYRARLDAGPTPTASGQPASAGG